MKRLVLIIGLVMLIVAGCQTITMHPQSSGKLASEPDYQQSKRFFFWGLVGEHRVDVNAICQGKGVKQMQSQQTFQDGLLSVITLGIYEPHSVKIWCNA